MPSSRLSPLVAALGLSLCFGCSGGKASSESATEGATGGGSDSSGDSGDTETTGGTGGVGPSCADADSICITPLRDVDVLFVIDNSGSMAEEQARLSANFGAFIDVLEADDVRADYRIAITTTDVAAPLCTGNTPERGDFVLSSCVDRVGLGDFTFEGVEPPLDASFACTDYCTLSDADLAIAPTSTAEDPDPKPRPWIERSGEQTNLPAGVSTVQALQCFGPQGVNGCGFEGPLEALYLGVKRSETADEANFGFLRDNALLSVVIITDELDCSVNPAHNEIFVDNKVFWNDPGDLYPTSSMCWRAGVACDSPGPDFGGCWAANHDTSGAQTDDPDSAVLHPLDRYVGLLQEIEDERRLINAEAEVFVSVIAGVPEGFSGDPLSYTALGDGAFLDAYGVDPGCTSADGGAGLPPVRLREFAEAFEVDAEVNLFSICSADYSPALEAIAGRLRDNLVPACVPECVADSDPNTALLEPDCAVYNTDPETEEVTVVPKCAVEGDGFALPAGVDLCYADRVDKAGLTPETRDDMSAKCVEQGWNLEFHTLKSSSSVEAKLTYNCALSENPAADCPAL